MSKKMGLAYSNDGQFRMQFAEIHSCLRLEWQKETNIADYLLALEKDEFKILLFDCRKVDTNIIKWVTLVRRLRPRLPLIVVAQVCGKEAGAKLLEHGVFYLCQHPVDKHIITNVIQSAMKQLSHV